MHSHRQKRTVRRQHEPTGRLGLDHRPQATPDHHRKLGVGLWRLRVSPSHSGPAARAQSCLTRAGHRPVMWSHEIPDSGISHRNTGSSPRSGTEEGDISPVFAALEHAAGDFTTLGKNPLLEGSSPPSVTVIPHIRSFAGRLDRHPRAGCRQRRAIGVPSSPPSCTGPFPGRVSSFSR